MFGIELALAASQLTIDVLNISLSLFRQAYSLYDLYGFSGLILLLFGSRTTWRVEAQVLGQLNDHVALDYKKSVQDECTMISVAVGALENLDSSVIALTKAQAAITAQIAVTTLSLDNLSKTHWIVRGFSVFSLISSLMAVYYSTTQHRMLGRLLSAKQVRAWIRGSVGVSDKHRIIPPLIQILENLKHNLTSALRHIGFLGLIPSKPDQDYRLSDPQDLQLDDLATILRQVKLKASIVRQCFTPGVTSVITISAPQMLLSASLVTLLIELGVYLGFVWTRDLDLDAGLNDSRNVFIMYIVGLVVCGLVYSISRLIQNEDPRPERTITEEYLKDYIQGNPEFLTRLGLESNITAHDFSIVPITDLDSDQAILLNNLAGSSSPKQQSDVNLTESNQSNV